jgi:hypothetical protein
MDDLGELYRLAAERAPAGSLYNAASGVVRCRDAAEAAAEAVGAGVDPWPPDEADKTWGPWGRGVLHRSGRLRRARPPRAGLGAEPTRPDQELRGVGRYAAA